MGDVISGIGIAAAYSIGYLAPARYRSNPTDIIWVADGVELKTCFITTKAMMFSTKT